MASLYSPSISNEKLLTQINLRHKKINMDYEYTSTFPCSFHLFRSLNWTQIDFTRSNVAALSNNQGIYMFTYNPYLISMSKHNAEIILYIGQANDLKKRLIKYFSYPNSKKASDQEKRFMILFFSNKLKLLYYQTPNLNQTDLDDIEYSLIDSILPPFNLKVKSEFAQTYRRLIQ